MTRLELIEQLIEQHGLKTPNRSRNYLYKRYYLYNELRTSGFSLSQIGEIFGKHHASIIHGLKTHENLMGYNDEDYKNETFQLKEQLAGSVLIFPEQKNARKADLKTDIIEARTIRDFKRIRRRVKLGVYEKVLEQSNFIES